MYWVIGMKKDQKFLNELGEKLGNINESTKEKIVLKYKNLIDKQKNDKRRIVDIIKSLGNVDDIAKSELELLKDKSFFSKLKYNFIARKDEHLKNKEETKKIKNKNKKKKSKSKKTKSIRTIKYYFNKFKSKFTHKKDMPRKEHKFINKFKRLFKKKDTLSSEVDAIVQESKNELSEVAEIYTEKKIFETKSQRTKRIIFKTLGLLLILVCIFIWLFIDVAFISSLFAILDGIKFYGISVALFGLSLVMLWVVIIINKAIFKRHINNKWSINFLLSFIFIIAIGLAFTFKEYNNVTFVNDVSDKYSMTRSYESYYLRSDKDTIITFNSNYNTSYIMNYDDSLDGKFYVEVKYYECYYDFYAKRTSDELYISLRLDPRDRMSVYIDDLRDNKIYDEQELSRYIVKITASHKDAERIIINN